jgi:hypothetical protein
VPSKKPVVDEPAYAASAINLRRTDWRLLRRVAESWAEENGGRPSVSKVIERLIDANRKPLEKKAKLQSS